MGIIEELQAYRQKDLKNYKDSGVVEYIEILAAKDSCDNCKGQAGKRIKLADALIKPPLPIHNCTHEKGYCRCTYIPVVK